MNAKLILEDGREISVTVDDKVIATVNKPKHGLEELVCGDKCFDGSGNSYSYNDRWNREEYSQGLILTNEKLQHDRIRARKVKFALEKFAAEHNEPMDWKDGQNVKIVLLFDYRGGGNIKYEAYTGCRHEGCTYFSSVLIAKQAVEELDKDGELTWYLRDYQSYIGCFKENR